MNKKYDVVILSGGFDPPTVGHLRMIKHAAKLGNYVVVGCNTDEWLVRKKKYRLMDHKDREEVMSFIKGVDVVISFNDDDGTAVNLIEKVATFFDPKKRSIAFLNGGDRKEDNTPEKEYCMQNNIDMVWNVGGGKIRSSSELVKDLLKQLGE